MIRKKQMKFWKLTSSAVALSLSILLVTTANAAPIKWNLENVTLIDGQLLTGFFSYDQDTNIFSNMSITNSGNDVWTSTTFNITTSSSNSGGFWAVNGEPQNGDPVLIFLLQGYLTNTGGTINVGDPLLSGLWNCTNNDCSSAGGAPIAKISGGTLTAVPLPAAVWLFGLGLLSLFGFMKRKNS